MVNDDPTSQQFLGWKNEGSRDKNPQDFEFRLRPHLFRSQPDRSEM